MSSTPKIALDMSREQVIDHLAHLMRDRAYPEYTKAPVPLWATDAAEKALAFFEEKVRERLGKDERLLISAYRWMYYLEEPRLEVKEAWFAAARTVIGDEWLVPPEYRSEEPTDD